MFNGKKILCVASAMLIALPTMLTGCSGSKTSSASSTAAASVASTSSAAAPVTLTIWLAGDAQQGVNRIDKAINTYLKGKGSNISVNVQMMGWGDDFSKKATTMFTSGGSDADIVFTCNWVNKYRQNANNGYLEDLTSYLKTDKGQEIVKILGQDFLNGSKIKGVNYALPTNKEKAHDWGFLVRTDLYKKYNMASASIKTLADMEPYFAKAKADNVTALDIAAFDSPWHFLDWDMVSDDGVPAAINDTTNKAVNPFTDSTSVALYKTLKGYADKGYISKSATTSQGIDADLKTGKYFCGVDSLKPGKDKEESQSTGVNYTQIDITKIVKSNRETTGAMLGINKFSKNKDAAFDLLYMLYTDDKLINLLNFGEEDKDYTVNSDGSITMAKKSDYAFGQGWMFGNQFKDLLLSTETKTKWTDFEAFNDKATVLPSLGFMYDDSNMKTQEATLANIVQTYYKQLLAGQVDVDSTVSAMSAKFDAAGEKAFLADIQTQYDAFLKAK
jgi:putative aldouronate transport system substrate-binding protein